MAQLYNIATVLSALRGVSFIGLDMETVIPLKGGKGNPMQGRVTKRTIGNTVLIAQNKGTNTYQNMVRKRIVGELLSSATEAATAATSALATILDQTAIDELSAKIETALADTADERAETAEERFQVKPRKWGQRIPNTPFIEHTVANAVQPAYYLDTIFLRAGTSEFFLDGQSIAEGDIQGYEKPVAKESANVQGGLKVENQVIVRSIGLASILAIRTGGKEYAGNFYYA